MRKQFSAEAYGTKFFAAIVVSERFVFLLYHPVIEAYIVCYKYFVVSKLNEFFSDLIKFWCISYHFIGDVGEP